MSHDGIRRRLQRAGLPWTRENYIRFNWGVVPEEWTAEHEEELPQELQDCSIFNAPNQADDSPPQDR
jgi:hypothetical protein